MIHARAFLDVTKMARENEQVKERIRTSRQLIQESKKLVKKQRKLTAETQKRLEEIKKLKSKRS
jgi:hypothetical protein